MKFIIHRLWRKYMAHLEGSHEDVKARYRQREQQALGHMPLLGFMARVLWGSQSMARLYNSTEKESGFVKLCRDGPGGREGFIIKYIRSHIRSLYLPLTLKTVVQSMYLYEANVRIKSLKTAWPNNMDAKAAMPWSSLAKLRIPLNFLYK